LTAVSAVDDVQVSSDESVPKVFAGWSSNVAAGLQKSLFGGMLIPSSRQTFVRVLLHLGATERRERGDHQSLRQKDSVSGLRNLAIISHRLAPSMQPRCLAGLSLVD
jgi:hypothetical protein